MRWVQPPRDARLEIELTERDRRKAAKLLAKVPTSTKLVAIGIGAASPGRRWPLERYADVMNLLAQGIQRSVRDRVFSRRTWPGAQTRRPAATHSDHRQRSPPSRSMCGAGTMRSLPWERQRLRPSCRCDGLQSHRDFTPSARWRSEPLQQSVALRSALCSCARPAACDCS